jgi:uncharacterized protein
VARLNEFAVGKLGGHKYIHGLYGTRSRKRELHQGAVYVGAGIGAAVIPIRLGERGKREVTVFELGHAPGAFEEHHAEQPPLPGRKPTADQVKKRIDQVVKKRERRARRRTREVEIE